MLRLVESQNIAFDVHRDKVNVRIAHRFLCHESALAAAKLQMQRLLLWKKFMPVTDVIFRIVYTAKWTLRKFWARPLVLF